MPKITLNGKEIEVAPKTTVIQAAFANGVNVPHYCWHPALSVVASCRICQIEIQGPGPRRLATACNTECVDGMVVQTETPAVSKARAGNLEDLLLNHPLDCPICDKAGECWLQDYAYEYGAAVGRNDFPRRSLEKRKKIAEHVVLDQERCILCTRCVRFLTEYSGKTELVVTERGEKSVIDIYPDEPVKSEYQGNLADICPVGALTLEDFRFKNRVWYLTETGSVCPNCSRGCSIDLDVRTNALNRVRPRTNPDVNGYFICDRGRFGLLGRYHPEMRVEKPEIAGQPATLGAAAERLARAIETAIEGGKKVVVLASPDATNEELFLLKRIVESVPRLAANAMLAFRAPVRGKGDDKLFTGELAANVAGAKALGFRESTPADLEKLAPAVLWVVDGGLESLATKPAFLAVQAVASPLATEADVLLPGSTLAEKDGTLTNFAGITQRIRAALKPPATVAGDLGCIVAVGRALGLVDLPATGSDAFAAFADSIGRPDLTLANLGERGVKLAVTGHAGAGARQ